MVIVEQTHNLVRRYLSLLNCMSTAHQDYFIYISPHIAPECESNLFF